jgi:hypothetical protein
MARVVLDPAGANNDRTILADQESMKTESIAE